MKSLSKLKDKWQTLIDTVMRFPLTIILLIAAVVSNAIAIETQDNIVYSRLLITFILGALLFVVFQMIYERFCSNPLLRLIFMLGTVAVSSIYFIIIRNTNWEVEVTIRTIIILFILLIAFLWIPVIKSNKNFNESFMAFFKGFFLAVFFNGVIYLGVFLIINAANLLIFKVADNSFIHSANIIFVLIAPTYLLTLFPLFPGKKELEEEKTADQTQESINSNEAFVKLTTPAKFLETLISYVIIPITAVFTIILLIYIIMNVTGEFWTDNLMEPMLVSYSITVIIVYLLASTINNSFAVYFRKVFPKVLIPVVLFQTLSSILRIADVGITYGRYYVILFGIFATAAGVIFSILPVRKNGIIAPILIALSIISIIPPIDSFTLSKTTQIARLENVLTKNNMLSGDIITPKANLSEEDKEEIMTSVNYIDRMGYSEDIDYLTSYNLSLDFEKTFGFSQYDDGKHYPSYYYSRNMQEPIPIAGYDYMAQMSIYSKPDEAKNSTFEIEGKTYHVRLDAPMKENQVILLEDSQGQVIIQYEFNNLFTKFSDTSEGRLPMPTEELTFQIENEEAVMTIVANSISYSEWEQGSDKSADLFILINVK